MRYLAIWVTVTASIELVSPHTGLKGFRMLHKAKGRLMLQLTPIIAHVTSSKHGWTSSHHQTPSAVSTRLATTNKKLFLVPARCGWMMRRHTCHCYNQGETHTWPWAQRRVHLAIKEDQRWTELI